MACLATFFSCEYRKLRAYVSLYKTNCSVLLVLLCYSTLFVGICGTVHVYFKDVFIFEFKSLDHIH